jgi:2-C-methyl-D-erythritol 2,4-cyclodiphosphate synthase
MNDMRVGHGYDVHAFVPGRRLVLGGIDVPYAQGLLGHSDADALLHAITDAVLGAAGLGDIGALFPDTDPAHKNADSRELLRLAMARVAHAGWRVVNVDATVVAQRPKLAPHVAAMRESIAQCLAMEAGAVSVKGKTTEHLGFVGRGEGIAAYAVVLLGRQP